MPRDSLAGQIEYEFAAPQVWLHKSSVTISPLDRSTGLSVLIRDYFVKNKVQSSPACPFSLSLSLPHSHTFERAARRVEGVVFVLIRQNAACPPTPALVVSKAGDFLFSFCLEEQTDPQTGRDTHIHRA